MQFAHIFVVFCFINCIWCLSASTLVAEGDRQRDRGRFDDAARAYSRALTLEAAPTTRWKLAASYVALNRLSEAATHLRLLDLESRPRLLARRADVYIKLCRVDSARADIATLAGWEGAPELADRANRAEAALAAASGANPSIKALQSVTDVCTHDADAWRNLARAALRQFDADSLSVAGARLQRIETGSADGLAYSALATALEGEFDRARSLAMRALGSDPDCSLAPALRPLVRAVKTAASAEAAMENDENEAIRKLDDIFADDKLVRRLLPTVVGRLYLLASGVNLSAGNAPAAEEHASAAIRALRHTNTSYAESAAVDARLYRAEAREAMGELAGAQEDAMAARQAAPHSQRVHALLERLQQARAQEAQSADDFEPGYYEALGLTKTADAKEIKAAYRRKTREYHPDSPKNRGLSEKELAERAEEYQKVQTAYETLSDADKRRAYDKAAARGFKSARPTGFPGGGFPGGGFPGGATFHFGGFPGGGFPGGGFPGGGFPFG